MTMTVVFIGPAGSGKTSLCNAYGRWAREFLFLKTAYVNLDPGAESTPYTPVFDVRKMFTLRDIMREYGLGPNGAFIKASELIAENIDKIMGSIPFTDLDSWDLVLIDTPGQMEAFILRPSGNLFFKKLREVTSAIGVYVIDASAISSISDALVLWLLGVLTQLKTGIQVVPVINKIDLAGKAEYAELLIKEPEAVVEVLKSTEEGLMSDVSSELVEIAMKTRQALRPVKVSAKEGRGIEDLHYLIHEAFCTCGDLT